MGQPKALLEYQGETFLSRMIRLFEAHCDPVVVVLAPGCGEWMPAGPARASAVQNPKPERGMLSSLQCGLDALMAAGARRILFTPMDLPALLEETVALMAREAASADVVIPRFGQERGHPVAISRAVAAELLALDAESPDVNPKQVLRRDPSRIRFVDVEDPGAIRDVDDPRDYQELLKLQSSKTSNVETFS
jgi:molybdenum cofactor cytidylyltransferase